MVASQGCLRFSAVYRPSYCRLSKRCETDEHFAESVVGSHFRASLKDMHEQRTEESAKAKTDSFRNFHCLPHSSFSSIC